MNVITLYFKCRQKKYLTPNLSISRKKIHELIQYLIIIFCCKPPTWMFCNTIQGVCDHPICTKDYGHTNFFFMNCYNVLYLFLL